MRAWFGDVAEIDQQRAAAGKLYREFLRVPTMSAGLYVLAAGATDPQKPHHEDEMYYVLRGRGGASFLRRCRRIGGIGFLRTCGDLDRQESRSSLWSLCPLWLRILAAFLSQPHTQLLAPALCDPPAGA